MRPAGRHEIMKVALRLRKVGQHCNRVTNIPSRAWSSLSICMSVIVIIYFLLLLFIILGMIIKVPL